MKNYNYYDVVIVGGGHAGTEAAAAASRIGAKTALITHNISSIGEMSCNPAIGGLGKGHLVREIDSLDGIMGQAIDNSGIQFRMLNMSKGAAVRGPRAQADRSLYKKNIYKLLKNCRNLSVIQGSVNDIIINRNSVNGVIIDANNKIYCKSLVLTAGTFLRGEIKIGNKSIPAGRIGDKPSVQLAKRIEKLGFSISRLKTGTPPRILKNSIKYNDLVVQSGDKPPSPFSFFNK